MLTILVDEEYGYRYWEWRFPGSREDLVREWRAGRLPLGPRGPRKSGSFLGEIIRIPHDTDRNPGEFDEYAHIHDEDDTFLLVDGRLKPGEGS